MDPYESPFSNLDVECDWTGDPDDAVDLSMTVEVWCTPNMHRTVLNTRSSSVVRVMEYTFYQKSPELKGDSKRTGLRGENQDTPSRKGTASVPTFEKKLDQTQSPARRATVATAPQSDDLPRDPDAESDSSDSGSIIVRSGHQRSDGLLELGLPTPTATEADMDETERESRSCFQLPRKRSARDASLPESVSDPERGSRSLKHTPKKAVPESGGRLAESPIKHLTKSSLIPRPVSLLNQKEPTPEKVLLPRDSAPVTQADFRRFEPNDSPVRQEILEAKETAEMVDDEEEATRETFFAATPLCKRNLDEAQELDTLSTVASLGSPNDTGDLLLSFGSSPSTENTEDHDGVRLMEDLPLSGLSVSPDYGPVGQPQLFLIDGIFHVQCPPNIEPAAYSLVIALSVRSQPGRRRGWNELVLPGLPQLRIDEYGYLYFYTPGQGVEISTTPFKRHKVVGNCLMAQFTALPSFVISLRVIDAKFYGFLSDFKVNHRIRAGLLTSRSTSIIKYHAVCSLDLIQRVFWAEECGFTIYLYGGPEGRFSAHLNKSRDGVPTVHLDSAPDCLTGVTRLDIICSPTDLDRFVVKWKIRLQRATFWLPSISATLDENDIEEKSQAESRQLEAENRVTVVTASPKIPADDKTATLSTQRRQTWTYRTCWKFCGILLCLLAVTFTVYHASLACRPCMEVAWAWSNSTQVSDVESMDGVGEMARMENGDPNATDSQLEPAEPREPDVVDSQWVPKLSLRDRVDYFLGWRGPIVQA